jgi:hypothetical protein
MSYDLYFQPRTRDASRDRFVAHFEGRPHYTVKNDQAWYENGDTGAYFVFEYANEPPGDPEAPNSPFAFNLNFYRPSYFAREADPEIREFVKSLELLVDDPQLDGVGIGEFESQRFLESYASGNAAAYRAILETQPREKVFTLPSAELERIWLWNRERRHRQNEIGESHYVSVIQCMDVDGAARSAGIWPDALPTWLPETDYVLVGRKALAPRRLLRKTTDMPLVPWSEVEPLLGGHASRSRDPGLFLDYAEPPAEVVEFVRSLPFTPIRQRISADSVLDAELVAGGRA